MMGEGGASQFNGAGFMPSPPAQDGPSSGQKKSYDQQSQSVRRLTIKQIADGLEQNSADGAIVDGKEVSNVRVLLETTIFCDLLRWCGTSSLSNQRIAKHVLTLLML